LEQRNLSQARPDQPGPHTQDASVWLHLRHSGRH
jgi:hypothetical protein